ncbi:MAG: tetratricopeptide repeat protein [Candidatus Edwardsbacteria bacterium]|nr:tetratricopeptide repeat protein [Candidatus Edwardsbacteria bacterium]
MKQIKELEGKLERLPAGAEGDRQRVDLFNELAHRYLNVDSKKAMALAMDAQKLAQAVGHTKGLAGGLWAESMCHFWHGDYPSAIARSTAALSLFQDLKDAAGQANAHNVLGSTLLKTGEHAQALIHHLKSLKHWKEANDAHGLATIYNNLGADYSSIGDYARALEYYQQSLALKQEADDPMGAASTMMNIGGIHEQLGDHAEALAHYQQSLKLFEAEGDARQGIALNNIGAVYDKQREFQNALSCYQRSLKLAQAQGYREAEAAILGNIGATHFELGQHQPAEEFYQRSLAIAREIDEKDLVVAGLVALGEIAAARRTFQDAVKPLREALAIAEHVQSKAVLVRAYQVMSAVHKQWERCDEALAYFEKAVAVEKEITDETTQRMVQNLTAQCEVGKYQKELEFLRHKSEELERTNRVLAELNDKLKAADDEKTVLLRTLENQNARLAGMVTEEPQTGLSNKHALRDKLKIEIARSRRYQTPLTVALARIDNYDGSVGRLPAPQREQTVRILSRVFRENLRLVDVAGWLDDRTAAFVFPETGRGKALPICERLQKLVAHHDWREVHGGLLLSVSMGLSDSARTDDPDKRIGEARMMLETAARRGPGRIGH